MDLIALFGSVAKPVPLRHITNELARRQANILASLDEHAHVLVGPSVASLPTKGQPLRNTYQQVVSVGWLGASPDLRQSAAYLVELLNETGQLHFVEPSLSFGYRAQLASRFGSLAHRRSGWWPNNDVPAILRSAGLVITDLERFEIPNVGPLYSSWVQGCAHRALSRPDNNEATGEFTVSVSNSSEGGGSTK